MAKDSRRNKIPMLYLCIVLILFLIFIARIAYIMILENDKGKEYSDPAVASSVIRGEIIDRNGNVLANQTRQWALYFRLSAIDDLTKAAVLVSPYTDMSVDEIISQAQKYTTYALIKNRMTMEEADKLEEAIRNAGMQNEIVVESRSARSYSSLFHACQLIGFMNAEDAGSEGIEYAYDDVLSPYPGLGEDVTYGADVHLTLDLDVQYLVDVEVQNIAYDHNPDYIMALVADASTGDILAMSSYPWYDLNYYGSSSEDERLNRTLAYNYEPGSVFKVFTLAKCMDEGIDTSTPFICDGSETFTVGDSTFTINCHSAHGAVDARNMISLSCNGAIASWCLQLSDEDFYNYLRLLGFGTRPELELGGITSGYLSHPENWSSRSKATIAFGQEISVNALQIVQAATAIANNGVMNSLRIVDRITDHEGNVIDTGDAYNSKPVMTSRTANEILSYMETAVKEGTAKKAAVGNVDVRAKTGTAEIINPESGSYEDGTNLASTLAIAGDYIVYFAISAPKGNSVWGADIAAPACGNVIAGLVRQGKIRTSDQSVIQLN